MNDSGGGAGAGGVDPDDLIRKLINDPEWSAIPEEIASILGRVASAPFNTRLVEVPPDLVGVEFLGKRLGRREDSLTTHLAQRILADDQWAEGTTRDEFLEDIRAAVMHPDARVAVYETRRTSYAAVAAPNVVPPVRLGDRPGRHLVVFYSANRGRIISARQARDESRFNVPQRARWLK